MATKGNGVLVRVYIQSGPKSDALLVFEFPLLDGLYLKFLFTHISFPSNDVVRSLAM